MAEKTEKKIDPFDVAALEKSLNDSATRVSTIWVSFLIFSLYLLTAATTVTHRQLFLAEPVKLPVLNIDLPLWGFFFLAPILFVILHTYVLIQVILLARTAAAYNEAIAKVSERDELSPEQNASLRQRLANTLFAQIFAGSPREREGAFGGLLRAMAWITLAISPILILLAFQFMFLPYHSHLATWTHRLLILIEFVLAFQLWPLVLDPQRDVRWPSWRGLIGNAGQRLRRMLRSGGPWTRAWQGLRRRPAPLGAGLTFALLSLWLASFPGEWHVNLFTGQPLDAVQCRRWLQQDFGHLDLRVDRLSLPRVDIVDDEKLERIEAATRKAGERAFQGERTRILRERDLNCGDFSDYADLRRVDLTGAKLRSANFRRAKLQGSSLEGAELQGASPLFTQLQDAFLDRAQLQGASLEFAQLQGASLESTQLQGAYLNFAELQGASLNSAQLQGAVLSFAVLQGASLNSTQLQGAILDDAQLEGAILEHAQLQGASLNRADLGHAVLWRTWIWRARHAACKKARVIDPQAAPVIGRRPTADGADEPIPADAAEIETFIKSSLAGVPEELTREEASRRMREGLTVDQAKDASAALADVWLQCAHAAGEIEAKDFDAAHIALLQSLVCHAESDGTAIGSGVRRNFSFHALVRRDFGAALARALLGEDGRECPAAKDYDEGTKRRLRAAAGLPSAAAPK